MKRSTIGAAVLAFFVAGSAGAQQYSRWEYFDEVDGVEFYYAYQTTPREVRVKWKCVNTTSSARTCSIGGRNDKSYQCFQYSSRVGTARALGEQSTVRAGGEYVFMPESVCQNTGATGVVVDRATSVEVD